ncbi:MAG: YeeE/YedE thiosulfate transporter family protein [Hyphomicrobium sp.]
MQSDSYSAAHRALTRQWSFFWAGITFGIAQIIYMVGVWIAAVQKGRTPSLEPITVTTDLGRMFRALEMGIYKLFALPDFQIYGNSLNGVTTSDGAFVPGVGWPIVGMMIGGWLVARAEKESRTWVYYPTHVLVISFLGGIVFSYGTRLAGGCTLNHLLGGLPLLNIHSMVTVAFMAIGGAGAFYVLSRVKMAPYFKHQETRAYVVGNDVGEAMTYREGYKGHLRPIYWVSLLFSVALFGVAIYGGLFNPDALQHLSKGKLVAFGKSLDGSGWFYVTLTLLAGIVGGFGMAKSGFGTECALVAAEAGQMMKDNDSFYARIGVPRITRTLMRSYLPMIGIIAHWLVLLGFVIVAWVIFGVKPGFVGDIKYQTTVGNLIGGLLLGAGAVMLVGCEIRSYMRVGMGYLNTWVGFMGFAVGYLPYSLYYKGHEGFLKSSILIEPYKVYDLIFPNSVAGQQLILVLWWVVLLGLFRFFLNLGVRTSGASADSLLHKSTEEVQVEIDREGKKHGGRSHGVDIPVRVPATA